MADSAKVEGHANLVRDLNLKQLSTQIQMLMLVIWQEKEHRNIKMMS